tara:strand:+ start:3204 stop:4376 length:1173 start_codon:yes stop_codon:yes gene_type:complete
MKQQHCPACESESTEAFFVVKNAPVQSVVTIRSYEDAIAIPRKDITLTFCNSCGFIFNSSFDTGIDYYSKGYEDQQGFSPTFKFFITGITSRFINKYAVHEKSIVEIGCGKGDFLHLICELGNNTGVGIDPAFEPGREKPNGNVTFIKDFYSERYGQIAADVIVCRHTLEHIHDPGNFVHTIRESIDGNADVTILVEVPSMVRILKVQAFWDIFYEHCSYFSPGSLARLFKRNNFEILDSYLEYDDQYLLLEAKPTRDTIQKPGQLEEDVEELRKLVYEFVAKINHQMEEWRKRLLKMKAQNKRVAVWGGGSKAVGFLTHFDDLQVIKHVVDINPNMQGNFIPGIGMQYTNPDYLQTFNPDVLIVMNGVYQKEIRKMLSELDLYPEMICL